MADARIAAVMASLPRPARRGDEDRAPPDPTPASLWTPNPHQQVILMAAAVVLMYWYCTRTPSPTPAPVVAPMPPLPPAAVGTECDDGTP